jgi:hypothetical protein
MSFVVVPDALRDAINAKLDAALAALPDEDRVIAENDRVFLYGQLIDAFDRHGVIPEFTIVPNLPEFRIKKEAEE